LRLYNIFLFGEKISYDKALDWRFISLDCTARLWDLETGTQIHFFEEMATYDPRNMQYGSPRQVWHMDVSEDGKTMVCCLRDGRICVHDVDSGKRIQTLNGPE